MKITVFGATGGTGRHLVDQALEQGHEVTAFVRDPEKAPWQRDRLNLVQGDVRDEDAVERAVQGAGAVISALGPSSNAPEQPITQGTHNIIAAMQQHNVTRLIASCGAGVEFPQDEPKLFNKFMGFLVRTLSKHVYADMKGTVEAIRNSDLDWTIVRVPMLSDDEAKGEVRVGYVGKGTGARITRADMAAFMLAQVDSEEHLRDAPVISN